MLKSNLAVKVLKKRIQELELRLVEARYETFCPYDYKYKHNELVPYLTAAAEIKYYTKVQAALMKGLHKFGKASEKNVKEMEDAVDKISPALVYELEEKVTKHDQQALIMALKGNLQACEKVNPLLKDYLKGLVSRDTAKLIHPGTTSYDIVDTARAMMYRDSTNEIVIPESIKLLKNLVGLAEKYMDRVQIGRTHGQWTSPLTFGYALAMYAEGLADRIPKLRQGANSLEGKISGIVGTGASIASIVGKENALEFEGYVLEDVLKLNVSRASSQVTRKEKLADLTHYLITLAAVLADMSNSMRHLQRSEIHEIGELGEQRRGGSSADPSKSNPINFENVNGLFEVLSNAQNTVYHTIITDHQRDLRNSVMHRFEPTHLICGVFDSLKRLNKVMPKLAVYENQMDGHIKKASKLSKAEALNAILKAHLVEDSHERVRKWTTEAIKQDRDLIYVALEEKDINHLWEKEFSEEEKAVLMDLSLYTGLAKEKTRRIVEAIKNEFNF